MTQAYLKGTTDTSGGRWGVPVPHAVRPGTQEKRHGYALCGARVFVFTSGPKFEPDDERACRRCVALAAKPEKPITLTEIAKRIGEHLRRFERDPKINVESFYTTSTGKRASSGKPYYFAGAFRASTRVKVRYVSYQGDWKLTRDEALAYLSWLDAGNVGTHYEQQREAKRDG